MNPTVLAARLVATLPRNTCTDLFNPWADRCPSDTEFNSPLARIGRLAQHLDCKPEFLLIGEAAGSRGMRHSAIAFTSEQLLLDGAIPRVAVPPGRLTTRPMPYNEASATIVWRTLKRLGIAERTVLWNALPLHPFVAGNTDSNRTPTDYELMRGTAAMSLMLKAYPQAKVVTVGRKAEMLLLQMGITPAKKVRHPANGGATAFDTDLSDFVMGRTSQ